MDADDTSRLSAILIWVVAAAVICVAATWPRWHNTPPANATNSSSGSTVGSNSASTSAAAPEQASLAGVGTAPSATTSLPNNNAAIGSVGSGSIGVAPARRTRTTTLSHIDEINVPGAVEDWRHLNDKQRIALAPFVDEWAHLPDSKKRKWLAIAAVYQRMSPDEQQRLHARMLRWVQMTPDERTIARENYQMSRVLPPNARQEAWRAYEALSPAQKAKLAAAERIRRRKLVVSAPPGTRIPVSSRDTNKTARAGAPATLSTEKLVPLGAADNGGTANVANGSPPASARASQPPASSPSDPRGTMTKSAKGMIGKLNVENEDRP